MATQVKVTEKVNWRRVWYALHEFENGKIKLPVCLARLELYGLTPEAAKHRVAQVLEDGHYLMARE